MWTGDKHASVISHFGWRLCKKKNSSWELISTSLNTLQKLHYTILFLQEEIKIHRQEYTSIAVQQHLSSTGMPRFTVTRLSRNCCHSYLLSRTKSPELAWSSPCLCVNNPPIIAMLTSFCDLVPNVFVRNSDCVLRKFCIYKWNKVECYVWFVYYDEYQVSICSCTPCFKSFIVLVVMVTGLYNLSPYIFLT